MVVASDSPRLFVVGGGPFQLDIVRTAKALGLFVVVADRNPDAPGLKLADRALTLDIVDLEQMVQAAHAHDVHGVVTAASDAALPAVAAIAEARGLPGLSPAVVQRCRDKLETFRRVHDAGLPVPRTERVASELAAAAAASVVGGYPVVVKPRAAAGGRGVSVVRDRFGLSRAFARAAGYGNEVLVQRFVAGHAVGVEAFFREGEPIAAFVMDDQFVPGFVSPIGHALPSSLPASLQDQITEQVTAFASALGLQDGPANFDLRVERGEVVLLEVNARLGGNAITDLVRSTYGVDLSKAAVRGALGQDPLPALGVSAVAPTASRLVVSRKRGVASVSADLSALADAADVVSLELTVEDGAPLGVIVDDHAILGRCVVRGESPLHAVSRAVEVARAIDGGIRVSSAQ
ncbi:MAG: acetyl-CoA carboxylase biotin carboxylase subunit family protein [Sandaracinaceae bacterium]